MALVADALYNLELAKLLWAKARQKRNAPSLPDERPDPPPAREASGPEPEGRDGSPGSPNGGKPAGDAERTPGAAAQPGQAPWAGTLPVLVDGPKPQPLSPEDSRALLKTTAARLVRERQAAARAANGPERVHVRDW